MDRFLDKGKLDLKADYYAGCYRFRRKITSVELNLDPPQDALKKIDGLNINYLSNKHCCYIPPHLDNLAENIKTNTIITICTGCYYNLRGFLKDKGDYELKNAS